MYGLYEGVRDGVAEVLDPSKLEYVILLHFEADENGGMDRSLEAAPGSTLACSALSAILNLSGWNYSGRVEGHAEGEVIDLGKHRLLLGDAARTLLGLDDAAQVQPVLATP